MTASWLTFLEPSTLCLVLCAGGTIALGCALSTATPTVLSTESVRRTSSRTLLFAAGLPVLASLMLLLLFYFMNVVQYFYYIVMGAAAFASIVFVLETPVTKTTLLLARMLPLSDSVRFVFGCFSPSPISLVHNSLFFFCIHTHQHRRFAVGHHKAIAQGVYFGLAGVVSLVWVFTRAYALSNVLAVLIGVTCIAATQLPSMRFSVVLLACFFVYDIFWVFVSGHLFGESIMISVARGLIPDDDTAYPALITFRTFLAPGGSNILGMGDILLPGLFLCYLHRVDDIKRRLAAASPSTAATEAQEGTVDDSTAAAAAAEGRRAARTLARLRKLGIDPDRFAFAQGSYFWPAFACYFGGLFVTFLVMVVSQHGQPALLYLVPAVLAYPLIAGYRNGELKSLWLGAFDIPEDVDPDTLDGTPAPSSQQQQQQQASRGDITGIESDSEDDEDEGHGGHHDDTPATTKTATTTTTGVDFDKDFAELEDEPVVPPSGDKGNAPTA